MGDNSKVRLVIIGYGSMGQKHAGIIRSGRVKGIEVAGICCCSDLSAQKAQEDFPDARLWRSTEELFREPETFDAVLITTAHKEHVKIATAAFQAGRHVLCEKPIGISTKEAHALNAVAGEHPELVFAMDYNWRGRNWTRKVKELLRDGTLGRITRVNWIANCWFRTPAYHKSSAWRSSWNGEGGGLLLNQASHLLDAWQWFFGMPDRLTGFVDFGKFNDFLVDDNADLILDYDNGLRGVFSTSSGENPGSNHLEIHGENGKLTVDNGEIRLYLNDMSTAQFCRENTEAWANLPSHEVSVVCPAQADDEEYVRILQNFADCILEGADPIAPGVEGVNTLELCNGAYLSTWLGRTVTLPIDDDLYETKLHEMQSPACGPHAGTSA